MLESSSELQFVEQKRKTCQSLFPKFLVFLRDGQLFGSLPKNVNLGKGILLMTMKRVFIFARTENFSLQGGKMALSNFY